MTLDPPRESFRARREWLLGAALTGAAFLWFWFWRSHQFSGGDSEQWEREIAFGMWWRKRQMLSFALMQLTYTISNWAFGWSAHRAINFVSCAAGALALLAAWRMMHGRPHAAWAWAIVATAGFTSIFYGHIETYAQVVAALLLHLLAVQRANEGRWPPWTILATWGLMAAFHLIALFVAPVMLLILMLEIRRRPAGARGWLPWLLSALVILVFFWGVFFTGWGDGELVGERFVYPLAEILRQPWRIFVHISAADKLLFLVWSAGMAGPAAVAALWQEWRRRMQRRDAPASGKASDPTTPYLAGYLVCFLGFMAIWNPDAGRKDFDLFCFPGVMLVLIAARHVMQWRTRSVWMGLILGVNLWLWLVRPVVFAEVGRRGWGTIELHLEKTDNIYAVMLDERLHLKSTHQYLLKGSHEISIYYADHPKLKRVVWVRPEGVYRLIVNADGDVELTVIREGRE